MSADGSVPITAKPTTIITTIADVLRRLEDDAGLDPRRRREMCSALRTVCRAIKMEPGSLSAQPRHLRVLIAKVTPAGAGVSRGRWSNIRSLTLKALKYVGVKSMPGRYRAPHAPEWEALRSLVPDRRFRSGLSRFISYCTANGIGPAHVTPETFLHFGAALETDSLLRDPGSVYRDSAKLWNRAASSITEWPKLQVGVPIRRHDFALVLDAFPVSFREDMERFLSKSGDPDVFSDAYCKPIRALTRRNRRQNILMAATALVRSGYPVAQITGLDVLVTFDNAKSALRFLYERAGGTTTGHLYQIACLLKTIARHYLKKDQETVDRLRKLCAGLKPQTTGLTEKNRRFLRQFADSSKLVALLTLPDRIADEIEQYDAPGHRHAVKLALAVAVAIELNCPIRAENLAGLRLDRHIQRVGDKAYLTIPAEETKNDNPIEAELPPSVARLLALYIEKYRPLLVRAPSPWLFPGENGGPRSPGGFSVQISMLIAKETGVAMTLHQFRHLAAKLFLDSHPDGYETVRRLLGHKSIETTMRFYRELEAVVATRRYGEFLERLLAENDAKTAPQLRPRRRGRGYLHG